MKVIAVMNQKGGVGKTTVTVNLAASIALQKQNVLIIDADLQGNATTGLGVTCHTKDKEPQGLFELITNQISVAEVLVQRGLRYSGKKTTLSIIPATVALSSFDQVVRALLNKKLLMKHVLQEVKKFGHYDYVLIDCPPSLGLLTVNALVAADEVLIPVQPEFYALQGLSQLLDTVHVLQSTLNPALKVGGVVCSRYNRRNLHNEVVTCLYDRFKDDLFATKIHENIALAESPSHGKTVFEYDMHCVGTYDFDLLGKEFLIKQVQQSTATVKARARSKQTEL